MKSRSTWLAGALVFIFPFFSFAQTPSFTPDNVFKGSSLSGWHSVGDAKWSAEKSEITADGKNSKSPGWLFLDHSFQDTGVYVSFKCDGACDTGVLFRAEKKDDKTQGFLLSIKDDELSAYSVTLDANGSEVDRKKLRPAGGQVRFAPPPPDPSKGPVPPRRFPTPLPAPPGVTLPIQRPAQGVKKDDWNDIEILLDADILRGFLNDGGGQVSVATEDMNAYGPIALYVGPGAQVHFRNVSYKDLAKKNDPKEIVSSRFRMQRLNPYYYGIENVSWNSTGRFYTS